ncbi:MAG: NADH-quinone oxidoreductase subunit NuoH [Planctomycetota bacterium]|jgi:NADH-quinone oxidoreductase subunit H|nr:NADH-quinone oxidoreductase subunit NuoH [Planctomycetota bacterium]MDA0969060.1 NADH-quinone oxidoreductase subunit NuoH [Planctomycetota bacterium]
MIPSTETIAALVKIGLLVGGLMTAAAYLVLVERWIAAWVQDRKGPNRVGIPLTKIRLFGLGQPLADGLKIILKEDFTPSHVDRVLYNAAPLVILATSLAIFAAIPFGSVLPPLGIDGLPDPVPFLVAPGLSVGILWVFALSSIAVYGVLLGGWASNNKYGFLGGLRSSAQLVAYEIPLGLGLLGVVLASGSLELDVVMTRQADSGIWYAFAQPLGFLVFLIAAFAEAARLPFDLPEAEQELVGGYHTEYSGIKLLLFLVAEFLHMVTAAFLIVILFLGGWHLWGVTGSGDDIGWGMALIRFGVFSAKILAVILFFMLVRWSWPRFRFDQLMSLAWKVMLPLGLANLVIVAIVEEFRPQMVASLGATTAGWLAVLLPWGVFLLGWITAGILTPSGTDNRPIRPSLLTEDSLFAAEHVLLGNNGEHFKEGGSPDEPTASGSRGSDA